MGSRAGDGGKDDKDWLLWLCISAMRGWCESPFSQCTDAVDMVGIWTDQSY